MQNASSSHGPVELRHWDVRNRSVGQVAEVPVHFSGTSQPPVAARQVTVDARNTSVGHATEVPVHVSATSHVPVTALQLVPDLRKVPTSPHTCLLLHWLLSQGPLEVRQTAPVAALEYAQSPFVHAATLHAMAMHCVASVHAGGGGAGVGPAVA